MPVSSPSDNRGKWRRRKRGDSSIGRKPRSEAEEEGDVDDEAVENDDDNQKDAENSEVPCQNAGAGRDPVPDGNEVVEAGGVCISYFPAVVRRVVKQAHSSVAAIVAAERASLRGESKRESSVLPVLENLSHGQLQAVSVLVADSAVVDQGRGEGSGGDSAYVISPPQLLEGRGVVKRFGSRVHVVPMHSDWFSPSTVNRMERQVVPHFFSGKSSHHTPEKYMECRNCVVGRYMDNPEKKLSVSDVQGYIHGVSNEDLTRIVRFLDHWGIINYCASDRGYEHWSDGSYVREDPNGDVRVISSVLKSIDSLMKFDKPKCRRKAADVYSSLSCQNEDFSDLDDVIQARLSENHCTSCSQPVLSVYYQSHKEEDILLCCDCFHDGRIVTGHSSLDFVRVDLMKDCGEPVGENWSDKETLSLLEGVEIYNENWNEIAEHVGTKTKAQCILHFLRLPMKDDLLENIKVPSLSKSPNAPNGDESGPSSQDADSESRLPFANSSNPVMSLVAFLTSAVGPRVAAACAHASLAALSVDDKATDPEKQGSGHYRRKNLGSEHGREGMFNGEAVASFSTEKVRAAAKVGLASAAAKTKLFADQEEREIQRLSAIIVNHQLKRLELKLKQFSQVENWLVKECEQIENLRQKFAAERSRIIAARCGGPSPMPLQGVSQFMVDNRQQQVFSTSQPNSHPNFSTFNNQQLHSQIPFMPRQQMFPVGPRFPHNAMQQSFAAPSGAMFNSPRNTQPTTSYQMWRGK